MTPHADLQHDPISFTALKVLQQRARFSTIAGCRDMARAAGIEWQSPWHRRLLRWLAGGRTASADYLQYRHDALTEAMRPYPGCAVLEFAAGFGTRGVSEHAVREAYVETDLDSIQRLKVRAVQHLLGTPLPARLHFRPVNVTRSEDMAAIRAYLLGLHLTQPLVIIHEGLMMYFNADEQAYLRDQIADLLDALPEGGVWLTPDFSERNPDRNWLQRLLSRRLSGRVGRTMNYFTDDDRVRDFLAAGGLHAECLPNLVACDQTRRHAVAEGFRVYRITRDAGSRDRCVDRNRNRDRDRALQQHGMR